MSVFTEEEIFAAALDKPSAERATFLDRACSGDAALRAEVEALLKAHVRPDSLLDAPEHTQTIDAAPPLTEGPGTRIGPYKLLQQIGEGGFGVVYMAEQQAPVRRKVALKIIKPGMDTKEVIARFESERQALALMDHPNIAKVLDAGATESGRPYFVMELVKGIPITQFCDDNHLPADERLELFIQVCNALQHAHQKGIIHRDLKPSNVMVTMHDGRPIPKVIDFGVAKATSQTLTERTLFTAYGQMIGTPAYMSPEQAEMSCLDVDTRSDIYSLGVLLYELLTGTTPFEAKRLREAGFAEMQRIIREEEPESVSTRISKTKAAKCRPPALSPQSRAPRFAELDWIVMKSLDKDREQRYESAISLARDIRRYLSDEPVHACPPTARYRFRKYAKKHRASLITAGVIAVTLFAAAAVSTWQAIEATHARRLADERLVLANERLAGEQQARQSAEEAGQEAETERKRAEAQQSVAEANFEKALDAVERMLARVGDKSVNDIPRMAQVQKELLEEAVQFYEAFLAERPRHPKVRLQAAKLNLRIAQIYLAFEDHSDRDTAIDAAFRLLETLYAEQPDDPEVRVLFARAMSGRSPIAADNTAKEDDARKAIQILSTVTVHSGESVENTAQYTMCVAYQALGRALLMQERYDEATQAYRIAMTTGARMDHPRSEASSRRGLAQIHERLGHSERALEEYREILPLRQKAIVQESNSVTWRELGTSFLDIGQVLNRLHRSDEAIPYLGSAAEIAERLVSDFPTRPRNRRLRFDVAHALGASFVAVGRRNEADESFGKLVDLECADSDRALMPPFMDYRRSAHELAAKQQLTAAIDLMQQVVRRVDTALGLEPQSAYSRFWFAKCSFEFAKLLFAGGQTEDASSRLCQAISTQSALDAEFPDNTEYKNQLAEMLMLQTEHSGQTQGIDQSKAETTRPPKPDKG